MRITFALKWPLGSLTSKGNVVGDELYATSLSAAVMRTGLVSDCRLSAPGTPVAAHQDVVVYFNDSPPDPKTARAHVLYLQNGYGDGSYRRLSLLRRRGYHGYALISRMLLDRHLEDGYSGLWMPFGVDLQQFYPRPREPRFTHEVAYIGNDIKGADRTMRFLHPATRFDFGLYGNWQRPKPLPRLLDSLRLAPLPPYKADFARISRGKISQQEVPSLYSSAAINLNCTLQDCVDWDVLTLRSLEVLACGGFLISDDVPSLRDALGSAVVVTNGGSDLVDKLEYYLSHSKERMERAALGPALAGKFSVDAMARRFVEYLQELVP